MSKEAVASATPVAKEPTVSVAEAMGLPTDWSMKSSITPGSKPSASAKDDDDTDDGDDEALPGEDENSETEEKSETQEPEKKTEPAPAKEKKAPEVKKAKETKQTAKPKTEPVAAPAKTEQTPPPAAKIKLKDKEYTQEELEALVAKANAPAAPVAVVKPVTPAPAPAKKEPTPEETKLQEADVKKKDDEWVTRHAPHIDVPVDEPVLEKILTGGAEGVAAFKQTIAATVARAVLMTRKSMYNELEPRFQQIVDAQQPLISAQSKAEDERAWAQFKTDYPDLENCRDLVETAANTLVKKDPDRIREMSDLDFYKEVATQVRTFTERFKPKEQAPAASPAAAVVASAPAAAAPAPAKAKVAPPGANLPTPAGSGGGKKGGGDSSIIASLM